MSDVRDIDRVEEWLEKEDAVWVTKEGERIHVSDMTTSHIENALAMLRRAGVISPSVKAFYATSAGPDGEMAQEAFVAECRMVFAAPSHPAIDWFENELKKREGEKL